MVGVPVVQYFFIRIYLDASATVNFRSAIVGLLVMVATVYSLGLLFAIVAGAVAGGIAGDLLSAVTGAGSASSRTPKQNDPTQALSPESGLAEALKRLDKVKKIRVSEKEFEYLAKFIAGIEKGDAQSHWLLGDAYLRGRVLLSAPFPKDKDAALFWFRRSAELGFAASQYHLGVKYLGDIAWDLRMEYSAEDLIEKNPDEAVKWLSKAADQSDTFAAFAQDVLGEMYFSGIVVKPDRAKAFDLFSKAEANPQNLMVKYGTRTRASERLPILRAEGHG